MLYIDVISCKSPAPHAVDGLLEIRAVAAALELTVITDPSISVSLTLWKFVCYEKRCKYFGKNFGLEFV